ncbi:hypothetical protein ACSBR2_001706 [Camellia fascicularis]
MEGSSSDPGLDSISLDDGDEISAEVANRCLIGKILAPKQLNKQAIEDRRWVLREAPWSVMGHLMILQPLKRGTLMADLDFSWSPFWVQIHGLPLGKLTKTNGEIIGRRMGQLITVDTFGGHAQGPSSAVWMSFKFEKLSNFCFDCGRIGHDRRGCKFVSREVGRVSGYGPELRTGIAKSNGGPEDSHRHKVLNPTSPTAGARGTATPTDTSEAQARITVQGDHDRSAAHASAEGVELERVEVRKDNTHSPKEIPDNHSPAHRGLPLSMGPSLSLSPLLDCGPGLEGQPSARLVFPEPGSMTPSGLQYFVTEPNDRLLDSSLRPILLNPYSSQIGIEEISPSASPTRMDLKTKVLDECMSCVFNSLTLKCKAQEDLEFSGKPPKLFKETKTMIVSSTALEGAMPLSLISSHVQGEFEGRGRGRCRGKKGSHRGKKDVNCGLVEVPVHAAPHMVNGVPMASDLDLSLDAMGECWSQVPSTFPPHNSLVCDDRALVAGLKQPHPPC